MELNTTKRMHIKPEEVASYYRTYIEKLPSEITLVQALDVGLQDMCTRLSNLSEEKTVWRYDAKKWTIKEIVLHLMDSERVFGYRALCFARQDGNSLPGYDHDKYVEVANANAKTISELLDAYTKQRMSTIALFSSFSDQEMLWSGTASNALLSVRSIGFLIAGHEKHHLQVIGEKYL